MIIALMLMLLPPKPLDASAWDIFQECMGGPGVGCHGDSMYRPPITDCEQEPGGPVVCSKGWEYKREPVWICGIHWRCLKHFDSDDDGDVDLADWALRRVWEKEVAFLAAVTAALAELMSAVADVWSSNKYSVHLLDALNAMLGQETPKGD